MTKAVAEENVRGKEDNSQCWRGREKSFLVEDPPN